MATDLGVRWPKLGVEDAQLLWSKNREFAMVWNAMSTGAPIVEPYLNKVMLRAIDSLPSKQAHLRGEIEDFVKQESNHYRMHMIFNRRLYAAGFDMGKPSERALKDQLSNFLETRSLAFNAAYCAGFENFTLFTAKFMFQQAEDLFVGADPAGSDLWLWHMAEEFEHRSVCHDAFIAVSGNYFMRIYGLIYSFVHLNGYIGCVTQLFLEKYREGMTEAERLDSIKREKGYKRRYALYAFPRMLAILLPFYDPGRAKMPRKLKLALERYTAMSA